MKKTAYLAPESTIIEGEVAEMICSSITGVGGDTGITIGEDETPGKADSRRMDVWEEEEDW